MSTSKFWGFVLCAFASSATILLQMGAPSAYLLAGVSGGAFVALWTSDNRGLPVPVQQFGMATVGIAAGGQIDADVLRILASEPVSVVGCVAATMAVTLFWGQLLRVSPAVSPVTALFASIAGGASGVTAVVHEIGGDDALVMAIQYLRVVAVLLLVPVAAQAFGAPGVPTTITAPVEGLWAGLPFTVICLSLGLLLARLFSFSASRLIVPLLVGVGFSVADIFASTTVPSMIMAAGFAAIGLMVGLAVTRPTLRVLLGVLPLAIAQLVLVLASCVGVGIVMARLTGMTYLDAFLASTPGGLPAVAAIAVDSGASVGVVVTVQLMRVFAALAIAAILGEWFVRRAARGEAAGSG